MVSQGSAATIAGGAEECLLARARPSAPRARSNGLFPTRRMHLPARLKPAGRMSQQPDHLVRRPGAASFMSQLQPAETASFATVDHVTQRILQWIRGDAKAWHELSPGAQEVVVEVWPLGGGAGHVTVGLAGCLVGGTRTAVMCIAAQHPSSDSHQLDGAVVHWACEKKPGGNWYPPPEGWKTDPDWSIDAGGGAWQTPLRPVNVDEDHRIHCVLLEIPLKGPLDSRSAGIPFVLKTADGHWLKNADTEGDFLVRLGQLLERNHLALAAGSRAQLIAGDSDTIELLDIGGGGKDRKEQRALDIFGVLVAMDPPEGPVPPPCHTPDPSAMPQRGIGCLGSHSLPPAAWVVDAITSSEDKAERSLMHRFQIAHTLLARILEADALQDGIPLLVAWLRFSAARYLTWNRNYNVKPREISAAQDLLTKRCAEEMAVRPELWELLRMALVSIGRGGEGNMGQRIRDEILTVQSKNGAKGGMMEEWHQKLHNNTSPDDVVICEALLAYLESDLDIAAYWSTLHAGGINRERLLSYDRAIRNEPDFSKGQVPGLLHDLRNYLHTLKAVHCGDDLRSAAAAVLGYTQTHNKGKEVRVDPVPGVATEQLRDALVFLLEEQKPLGKHHLEEHAGALRVLEDRLSGVMAARSLLSDAINNNGRGRLLGDRSRCRDVVFLDLALESASRSFVESEMDKLNKANGLEDFVQMWKVAALVLEGCCLSLGSNQELILCLKEFVAVSSALEDGEGGNRVMLRAQAAVDRLSLHLADRAQHMCDVLQPSAKSLGQRLGIQDTAINMFSEEVIRSGLVAPLSQVVAALQRSLRQITNQGPWQIVAPGSGTTITGQVVVARHLVEVQHLCYELPTILVALKMGGEEEVPAGVVAVVTPCATDILCHSAIRARNNRVLLATCHDQARLEEICAAAGRWASMAVQGRAADLDVVLGVEPAVAGGGQQGEPAGSSREHALVVEKRLWCGRWALSSSYFCPEAVGAKARNLEAMRGRLPPWILLPASVAIPFGAFEEMLRQDPEGVCARRVGSVQAMVDQGFIDMLAAPRLSVRQLPPNEDLRRELVAALREEGISWAAEDWPEAWRRITHVWSSQWNDRVVIALHKASLPHRALTMSVLCQPLLPARYAFVAHTTNPLTGDGSQVYIEVVRGLGETLVGNYAGTALRATASKLARGRAKDTEAEPQDLVSGVEVVGLPSKSFALVAGGSGGASLMFRSDSNCEDLDGFAGAGFFDSVPLVEPRKELVDYSDDPIVSDLEFQHQTLTRIAASAVAVEIALGDVAQDVEGLILEDGTLYVVQSRPQV